MPKPPKPPERRQRRNKPKDATGLAVVLPGALPAPPEGLADPRLDEWVTLWNSPLAKTYDLRSDLPALRRLFALRQKVDIYERAVAGEEVTAGSTGQLVVHPLLKQVDSLRSQIVQLEDRFGLSPMARLKLGITLGDATRSLEDLNRRILGESEDEDDDDIDPRLQAVDEGA